MYDFWIGMRMKITQLTGLRTDPHTHGCVTLRANPNACTALVLETALLLGTALLMETVLIAEIIRHMTKAYKRSPA